MKNSDRFFSALSVAAALALAGCGKTEPQASAPTPSKPASLESTIKAAQSTVVAAKAVAPKDDGNTYREQGTMTVDAGQGVHKLQSMATLIDPKLGEKTAARLGTSEGQKKLADATAAAPQVTGADIQATANQFAGRTMYSSQAMHAQIINAYSIELDAKSAGEKGVRMTLVLTVSDKDLTPQSAKVAYYPNAGESMQSYEKKIPISDVKIDKLERKDDKTFAISGSFKATDLPPSVLSKALAGKTLAAVSGQFEFAEVNIRKMFN